VAFAAASVFPSQGVLMKSQDDIDFQVLDSVLQRMLKICDQHRMGRGGRDRSRLLRQAKEIYAQAETIEDLRDALGILSAFLLECR
jgi:hypothetical protein